MCVGGGSVSVKGQSSIVHGAKERGGRQERVELPDSLM